MKGRSLIVPATLFVAVAAAAIYAFTLKGEVNRLAPKAEKFDAVCSLAKTALFVDRQRLNEPRLRDTMIDEFAGSRIGDGYVMLEWCVPDIAHAVAEVRRCATLRDYACIERTFREMEASIVP